MRSCCVILLTFDTHSWWRKNTTAAPPQLQSHARAGTHRYSKKVPKEHKVTNQKSSGRCWMFAALNLARATVIEKYNLPDTFEFSQAWTLFWDKYVTTSTCCSHASMLAPPFQPRVRLRNRSRTLAACVLFGREHRCNLFFQMYAF